MNKRLENKCLRLDCDLYGNPRYYVGAFTLADILGVSFAQLKNNQKHLKLTVYRGQKYGYGYVLTSYNVFEDLRFFKDLLTKILILEEKFPFLPLRVKMGRIELKVANRWNAYDDSKNGYFVNINNNLNID